MASLFDANSRYTENLFESIKRVNEYGQEFWYAREMQKVLEYTEWRNFLKVIAKARDACENSGMPVNECFVEVNKTSPMPHGGTKPLDDVMLSRYACYLIAMNGDPSKAVIALAQTYFAVKTRQQELIENYDQLTEDQKRLSIRREMIEHNKSLAEAAYNAGGNYAEGLCYFPEQGISGPVWRPRRKRNPNAQGLEKESEHPRPHGQHRACRQSVPRNPDR